MARAFDYIIDAGGVESESDYRYTGNDGQCYFDDSYVVATMTSYVELEPYDENVLQEAVANVGPISVAIDANSEQFRSYS